MDFSDKDAEKDSIQYGPETREDWAKKLQTKVKSKFFAMNNIGKASQLYINKVNKTRAIVDVQNLLQLFQTCLLCNCSDVAHIKEHSMTGRVLKVEWACANSHHGV